MRRERRRRGRGARAGDRRASAQEEAMKHVLPFKQRQIEQRQLEAEAEKAVAHQGRRRQRAGAPHRGERRGRCAPASWPTPRPTAWRRSARPTPSRWRAKARCSSRHPLLIQKTLADKLSDKVQVIIAPPGRGGGFIGGRPARGRPATRPRRSAQQTARQGRTEPCSDRHRRGRRCGQHDAPRIVTHDHAALRAAPRDSAPQQAQLWQGEVLEVRGERLDYLQVWDHARERGGYVRASQVRRSALGAGRGAGAAGGAALPARGAGRRGARHRPRRRLPAGRAGARRCAAPTASKRSMRSARWPSGWRSAPRPAARRARRRRRRSSAHLEVAARYGVQFASYERDGRMQHLLRRRCVPPRARAAAPTPQQQARAALALTRPECVDPALRPLQRAALRNEWRAEVLDRVDAAGAAGLPAEPRRAAPRRPCGARWRTSTRACGEAGAAPRRSARSRSWPPSTRANWPTTTRPPTTTPRCA